MNDKLFFVIVQDGNNKATTGILSAEDVKKVDKNTRYDIVNMFTVAELTETLNSMNAGSVDTLKDLGIRL